MRWVLLLLFGTLMTAGLFLLLGWIIRGPNLGGGAEQAVIQQVRIQPPKPELEKPPELIDLTQNSPPPPPRAPAAAGRPNMPALDVPSLAIEPVEVANVSVPVAFGKQGMTLGKSGTFGGFGSGRGRGTGGSGTGAGWKGKPLVPLSTARPQMPDWACDQKLNGWVEAIFTVMPNGRVQDVRIVDADPRGVFEAAAIESISHWIYSPTKRAAEVKQRVPMNHEDCAYNW